MCSTSFRSSRPLLRPSAFNHLFAPALFVPLLAAGILIGPAPVQDPRPESVPGPSCQERLAEAEATLAAPAGHVAASRNAP
jgi:hypothetical protein